MKCYVETDSEQIEEDLRADSRGRITLGSEYADKRVSVAVIEVDDDDE